jgi:nitroreductase
MLNEWLIWYVALEAIETPRRPGQCETMIQLNDRSSLLSFLKTRKSASAKAMTEPGPTAEQLSEILNIAVRVPDHGKLSPWRFIVFEGVARAKVGSAFRNRWQALHPDHSEDSLNFQAGLFTRAPVVVAVVSTAAQHPKIPVWEQQMSSAAVCFAMELAAQALGFDVQWQTDWVAYDDVAKAAMGLHAHENIAGLIYMGKSTVPLEDRPRPDVATLVTHWSA